MNSKYETLDWDDLRLFLAVARCDSLSQAARSCGSSPPTLSRRISELEAGLGVALFDRRYSGMALTEAGRALLQRVEGMEDHARSIQAWRSNLDPRPVVRIAAGNWTSVFLARQASFLSRAKGSPRIVLLSGAKFLNLLKHEADIAVRNKTPEQRGLRRKKIGPVGFAVYGAESYVRDHPAALCSERYDRCDWVLSSAAGGTGRSSDWLREQVGERASLTCDTPQAVYEAVRAGLGLCVLPCFIGTSDSRLVQCSDPIEELGHVQWLVTSDDLSLRPCARAVTRTLLTLFEDNKRLFSGGPMPR
ncbi:LysR family transcriptional regulator [Pelagibius marinus]|uniref:LysR family transcriptional regulator n=1 Tax=Pelagibius marinus TaxID=2762760 RepID=UPI001872F841|nr:LysR family transcriptional regulator [Pelagibius marinus]